MVATLELSPQAIRQLVQLLLFPPLHSVSHFPKYLLLHRLAFAPVLAGVTGVVVPPPCVALVIELIKSVSGLPVLVGKGVVVGVVTTLPLASVVVVVVTTGVVPAAGVAPAAASAVNLLSIGNKIVPPANRATPTITRFMIVSVGSPIVN